MRVARPCGPRLNTRGGSADPANAKAVFTAGSCVNVTLPVGGTVGSGTAPITRIT